MANIWRIKADVMAKTQPRRFLYIGVAKKKRSTRTASTCGPFPGEFQAKSVNIAAKSFFLFNMLPMKTMFRSVEEHFFPIFHFYAQNYPKKEMGCMCKYLFLPAVFKISSFYLSIVIQRSSKGTIPVFRPCDISRILSRAVYLSI